MKDNLKLNRAQHHCSEHLYGAPVGGSGPGHFYFREITMKRCFKCGEEKPLDQFYRHPQMADGHLGKCKECNKHDVSANYHKNIEKYTAYEKQRMNLEHRVQARKLYQKTEKFRKYKKQYARTETGKNSKRRAQLRSRAMFPDKYRASYLTSNAVRDGRLLRQPCSVCGNPKAQAHHEDYSKPLDVIWLCRKHHLELHGKMAYEF